MVEVFILGEMVGNMMVNINMIKNMDLEFIIGLMEENMKVIGNMVNNMEKVNIICRMV